MLRYLLGRMVSLLVSLVLASVVVFAVIEVIPGDPAAVMLGLNADPDTLAALRADLGLGGGPAARYLDWAGGLIRGDFGISYTYRVPVADLVAARLAVSGPLALMALALSVLVGLPAGIVAALRAGRTTDLVVMGATQLGVAIPNFWFAMLLVMVFAVGLGWAPSGGFPGWDDPGAALGALVLPAVALALPQAAILARVMRAALLETLGQDYIRTARAKGLRPGVVLFKHALRNAIIPVVSLAAVQFGFMLGGSIVIETIFAINGLGQLAWESILRADLPMMQAIVLVLSCFYIVLTFLADLLNAFLDPRIRVS